MNLKEDKAIFDKIQFVFHRIILGVIYWMVLSFFIAYQQFVIKNFRNLLTDLLLYLVPYILFLWFISICGKKNQWKPFPKYSDMIGIIIISIGFLIPFLSFLNVKIVQFFP